MIVYCQHGPTSDPQPCPPMCPCQAWPYALFRMRWWDSRRSTYWKLRRKYRPPQRRNAPATPVKG